jgi:hypothetical protein
MAEMDDITNKKRRRTKKPSVPKESEELPQNNINYVVEEYEEDDGGQVTSTPPTQEDDEDAVTNELTTSDAGTVVSDPPSKKRGRKPKGGKLITKNINNTCAIPSVSNIILHLKCSTQDLNDYNQQMNQKITDPLMYNPSVPPSIMTYNIENSSVFSMYNDEADTVQTKYAYSENMPKPLPSIIDPTAVSPDPLLGEMAGSNEAVDDDDDVNMKEVNTKIKKMKINLYKNTLGDKKSACFWCTYPFDNEVCYIPKYELDGTLNGYGSFCRPECAVAHLMKENIDDSTKFERYHLLNRIYSKVYDYKRNIKPAPNPYYLLDKFYGNLTIQEYRKLLKTEHMLLVIEKPLTRILPELHEDNEEFILNMYGGKTPNTVVNTTGVYKVKKQSEKPRGPSKNSIMRDNFGLSV